MDLASMDTKSDLLFSPPSSGFQAQPHETALASSCQDGQRDFSGHELSQETQAAANQFHQSHWYDNQSGLQLMQDNQDASLNNASAQSLDLASYSSKLFQGSLLGDQVYQTLVNNSLVSSTQNYYQWLNSFADSRVESWTMMSSPVPTLSLFFLYLIMANYGPSFMKTRKPMQLRWLLVVYNLYVSLLNLWIACELCYCSYKLNYRSMCQLVLITSDPYVMRIANGVWWYYASKGIEFADTLFFILRKKDRQLTFLHKYHHSSMFIVWWTAARFVPGGSAVIPIVVNSLVHVLMYAYYGLSALGPQMQKYLWWKRYLTIIQLIQFFVGVSIGIHLISSGCQFTRWMQYVFSGYAFSFIILFGNFYLNEYIKSGKRQQQGSTKDNSAAVEQANNKLKSI